jgi:hypothetical protein
MAVNDEIIALKDVQMEALKAKSQQWILLNEKRQEEPGYFLQL